MVPSGPPREEKCGATEDAPSPGPTVGSDGGYNVQNLLPTLFKVNFQSGNIRAMEQPISRNQCAGDNPR